MAVSTKLLCSRCQLEKPSCEFHAAVGTPRGFQYICKKCKKEQHAALPVNVRLAKAEAARNYRRQVAAVPDSLRPTSVCCSKCGQYKSPAEFYTDRSRPSGCSSYCRECKKATESSAKTKSRKAMQLQQRLVVDYVGTRRRARDLHLKADYGISLTDFESMLERQGGVCAICNQPPCGRHAKNEAGESLPANLHVDHDHSTGRVRALLCDKCNRGLGNFRDNPEFLEAAASYLRSFASASFSAPVG